MTDVLNPHWRARLGEIQDDLLVADDVNKIALALMKLTTLLANEWDQPHDDQARQLVREAIDLLSNPETDLDLRDWLRAAEQLVGATRGRRVLRV